MCRTVGFSERIDDATAGMLANSDGGGAKGEDGDPARGVEPGTGVAPGIGVLLGSAITKNISLKGKAIYRFQREISLEI